MILLSGTLTSLEKQQVLDQAAVSGNNYHLDKCDPKGLSQTAPLEEEGEREEGQRYWIPKRESQFPITTGDLTMILSGTLRMTRMNEPVTTSPTAFLRV
jgi:hypothetical protein